MAPVRTIAIMLHERDREAIKRRYRIWPIAENWRRAGKDVRVVYGPEPCLDADVLVPHIDCSYISDPYWEVIRGHPRALNLGIRDIRKRAISSFLIGRDDPYEGPVIVKTNNNSGGYRDLEFGGPRGPSVLDRLRKRLSWHPLIEPRSLGWTRTLTKYPIFEHRSQVPKGAWRNPHIVVEKFFEPDQNEKGEYVLYLWIVLGDRGIGRTLCSSNRYVKNSSSKLGSYDRPPVEILEAQSRLGIDYAKIDFVLYKGRPVLLDINRTPSVSGDAFSKTYIEQCSPLAEGIDSFG